ncbi:MAG TPA: DUF420 domain-containing protein [Verrucomicrobiales bacterium]|nr:DUF420 domain-containing protein [Verrucomicrobiales bacterium]HCN76139.1 DUF420 domain-containing protein [Verrucomicrobiales bacterium]HRJ07217.1 DUF420 domain-containing protein [Prosthecobacter sp.]HRK14303.1 DUF420 domain-containing protein [Prosthecobacter sp.]
MSVYELPKLYTLFNACALLHIILGLFMIRLRQPKAHIASMVIALMFSTAFLGCYLYYHYHAGHVVFQGRGFARVFYFTILFTHIPLAVINLPMIILTVVPAVRHRFDRHKRMARWTVPVWIYVSVTGVIIYLMCYVWYGPPLRS